LAKLLPGACLATGTKCALDSRRWTGRQAAASLRIYKEVVRVCTRVYELRKRIDGLQLTGGPSEDDLYRVSHALFNNVVTKGNRELMYKIASTPEFNVGRFEPRSTSSCQSARLFSSLALQLLSPQPPSTVSPLRLWATTSLTALSTGRLRRRGRLATSLPSEKSERGSV
jgi:hypothetical protein